MSEFDAHRYIGDALMQLASGLEPFIAGVIHDVAPELESWTLLLQFKDQANGRVFARYSRRDPALILRVLTERLGSLGYPFTDRLPKQARDCAGELRTARNRWAHNETFTLAETYRALDSAEILLSAAGAIEPAQALATQRSEVLARLAPPAAVDHRVAPPVATPAGARQPQSPSDDIAATPQPTPTGSTVITVTALPVLSYAHARAGLPVLGDITVEHVGPELRAASVEIGITSEVGTLGDPKIALLDLDGKTATTLRHPDATLDPARMANVTSSVAGYVVVTLRASDGTALAENRTAVTVLAANQWMATPPQLSSELLAAFVQPNSAVIPGLLREASDRLDQATGNPALDGYQSESRERVDAIVEAIYDSIRARDIRYAEPPASWGLNGQKVRTPEEVLVGRLGTCLDTTLTLAAALEEAGINSTLWRTDGHILLGYWRDDASLDGVAAADASDAANQVGLGALALVETTLVTGGPKSRSFADARRHPHEHTLADGTGEVLAVTDIRSARQAGILPLPSHSVNEAGQTVVNEYHAHPALAALHYAPPAADSPHPDPTRNTPPRVEQWKNALLDLSLRNRLINFTDRSGYSLAVPQPMLATFEDLINAGKAVTLTPSDRLDTVARSRGIRAGSLLPESERAALLADHGRVFVDLTEDMYATRLQALAAKAKTVIEETGANNLYLTFGMLQWTFDDRPLRSPLVLVPITLTQPSRGSDFRITIDEAGESTPNYCLLEKLHVSLGLDIPGLSHPAHDESGIDLAATLAATREALTDAHMPFTVEDTACLSILQFAKFRLWKDLDEHWEDLSESPLVSHLIHTPTSMFTDPVPAPPTTDLDALGAAVPVPADASQLEAVADATAGRSFVLEGPPGTGKSQTITNVLADALAHGKRVLFVAEKRAALDVVRQRIEAVGLGAFALDLHDKGARPNAVRAQIKAAIDAVAHPDQNGLTTANETARSSRGSLRRYAERLHAPNTAGLSLYSARTRLLASAPDIRALDVPSTLVTTSSTEQLEEIRTALRNLPETADLAHPRPLHPWGFIDGATVPHLDLPDVHRAAQEFDEALAELRQKDGDRAMLPLLRTPDLIDAWMAVARAPRHPIDLVDAFRARVDDGTVAALTGRIEHARDVAPEWTSTLTLEALETDVRSIDADAHAADASVLFGRTRRRRAALSRYGQSLRVDVARVPPDQISAVTSSVVGTADEVDELRSAMATLPLVVMPARWNPYLRGGAQHALKAIAWNTWLAQALRPGDDARDALRRHYSGTETPKIELADVLGRLAAAWRRLASVSGCRTPGADDEMTRWAGEHDVLAAWEETRTARRVTTADPVTLGRWTDMIRALEPLRTAGLHRARTALLRGEVPADLATQAFQKGVALASLAERGDSMALAEFDAAAHERTIERFTRSARDIRAELPRAIPARILAARRIDPSGQSGRVGELKRQLNRKRGGMSVRGLFENYGDLITGFAPCLLMSPESVARFLPARAGLFDTVVFDEASQIRVADAVGALGRGRTAVVVGDSKQMPPTSFAEVNSDIAADDDAGAVIDEESILSECVQAGVPRRWLSWHYRSQDETLIAFSNRAYYENRLSSFPAPWPVERTAGPSDHGVSLVRVAGHFDRSGHGSALRTNSAEADAIVAEVQRRFVASPEETPSLGIITFNAPQRTLIETLLRNSPDDRIGRALDERDGLFVKNLENAQGDERDTILFSIAFSANDKGVLPLNFGPLSRAGGERRLNVAITRARRQVVLYASFDPSELRAEQTSSVGIKDLKGYLELAAAGDPTHGAGPQREPDIDRHRDDIAQALRQRGHTVRTDVGMSDFRVDISVAAPDDPTQPVLAILLDGERWRERPTVADRDGLPVDVLQGLMHWPGVERVWMPGWLQHREAVLDRLDQAINDAAARWRGDTSDAAPTAESATGREADESPAEAGNEWKVAADRPTPPDAKDATRRAAVPAWESHILQGGSPLVKVARPTSTAADDTSMPDFAPRAPGTPDAADAGEGALAHAGVRGASAMQRLVIDYVPWNPHHAGAIDVLDALPARSAARAVRAVIEEVIACEGPVHDDRLVRLVAGEFGLFKVRAARAAAIKRLIPSECRRQADPDYAWPVDTDPSTWHLVRRQGPDTSRPLEHVSPVEIANAMAMVAERTGGIRDEELFRETLAVFGGKRLTAGVSSLLGAGLDRALASGRILRDGDALMVRPVTRD